MPANTPMNFLFLDIIKPFDTVNGSDIHKYELIRNLGGPENRVHVITTGSGEAFDGGAVTCSRITPGGTLATYLRYLYAVYRASSAEWFDILYARSSILGLAGCLVCPPRRTRRLVCEVNGLVRDESALLAAAAPGSRLKNSLNRRLGMLAERYLIEHADRIIAVTPGIRSRILEHYRAAPDRIAVVENGANTGLFFPEDRESALSRVNLPPSGRYVCFVGNFAPWQGVEQLIDAAPRVHEAIPAVRFLLVGDGAMRERWQALAAGRGLGDLFLFAGRVPYAAVAAYINASDLCVAPFTAERNERIGLSPLKIYEYLACGRPVVASGIAGVKELLEHSGGGICVDPRDTREFSGAIIRLLRDERLSGEMGERGRRYVAGHHDWGQVARRVAEICRAAAGPER
jgi:glycosyltransferase involved in cell wall biosynthesis